MFCRHVPRSVLVLQSIGVLFSSHMPLCRAAEALGDTSAVMLVLNAALESERSGKDVPWADPATGRSGIVRIERTFYRGQQPCRDYVRTTAAAAGSGESRLRGTSCRVGKSKWEVEEERAEDPQPAGSGSSAVAPASTGDPDATPSAEAAAARHGAASRRHPSTAAPAPQRPPPVTFSMPSRSPL
jgi:17 kDa outer membrane surface antigen